MNNKVNQILTTAIFCLLIVIDIVAQADEQTIQAGDCNIKGNVASSGEKIYHVPGQKFYNVTKITRGKGERYFCTEEEARRAGWRKSKV